jgi:hypothetical protein
MPDGIVGLGELIHADARSAVQIVLIETLSGRLAILGKHGPTDNNRQTQNQSLGHLN